MPRRRGSLAKVSKVPRLVYLPSARADLVAILRYIARESGSRQVGRRFVEGFHQQCRRLARLPGTLGTARPELRPDIRSFPHRSYVIFFRYVEGRFEVVNVIEGHRDMAQHISREDQS
jgi:plasmid stabilization system protein ParE